MPHIYSDLKIINDVLDLLPDYIRRNYISVGPYLLGESSVDPVFSNYRSADLVIAMRFHASVCSIGMGTPTIGINSYKKINDLYVGLGIEDRLVDVRGNAYMNELFSKSINILNDKEKIILENQIIKKKLEIDINNFINQFNQFLYEHN